MFNYLMGTTTNDYQINVSKQMLLFFTIKIELRIDAHPMACFKVRNGGGGLYVTLEFKFLVIESTQSSDDTPPCN